MFPCISCCLTDKNGTPLNPLAPGSIHYIVQESCAQSVLNKTKYSPSNRRDLKMMTVLIQGHLTIFADGKQCMPPTLFCIKLNLKLCVPQSTPVSFFATGFRCYAIPTFHVGKHTIESIDCFIKVSTSARFSKSNTFYMLSATAPLAKTTGIILFSAEKVFNLRCFKRHAMPVSDRLLKAKTFYYIARSSGDRKEYTDQDALPAYHSSGVLSPEAVSYCNLFVNGMLQPKSNYTFLKGNLTFNTTDAPPKGVFIVMEFVVFQCPCGGILPAEVNCYVAQSDGGKRIFTNTDALPIYSSGDIPAPEGVSYFNFYSNGVLQPQTNYIVKEGRLELVSTDLPSDGTLLILESISLKTVCCQTVYAKSTLYNALSDGGKIYTDRDALQMYGNQGIPAPESTSQQRLLVNSILQPPINYSVQKGCLSLHTEDAPLEAAPLTLQSVSVLWP